MALIYLPPGTHRMFHKIATFLKTSTDDNQHRFHCSYKLKGMGF
jgi:hypothetical protein